MTKYLAVPLGILLFIAPLFASAAACPNLYRNLAPGMRGQDVVELQNFLIAEGHLAAGYNTGYYGGLTRSAVQSFQRKHNIVSSGAPSTTGYGAVGPRTRAKILQVCSGSSYAQSGYYSQASYYSQGSYGSQVSLSASPTSGNAPLSVMFRSPLSLSESVNAYGMDFGDGASEKMTRDAYSCLLYDGNNCTSGKAESMYSSHRYQNPGTYIAKLLRYAYACPEDGSCPPPPPVWIEPTVIGTVTISVSGLNTCEGDVDAAKSGSSGTTCTAQIMKMRCPYDKTFIYSASNGCQISALQNKGWTSAETSSACRIAGCSGQMCVNASTPEFSTTCEYKAVYGCYQQHGICEVQSNGNCGWTSTARLDQCIAAAGNQ